MIKSINRNFLWSDVFVKQLEKCGVKNICISPGSRNTPLTIAFSKSKKIKSYVIVDERSSCFFALGIAKFSKQPTVLLTTSGTAVANLYPAIIEAYNSRIPLIVLTADRPDYLLNTGANQTINQINIFKNHIRNYYSPGLPIISISAFNKLKNIAVDAFLTSTQKDIGPVQINFPFEKPFEPSINTDKIPEENIKKFYSLIDIKKLQNKSADFSIVYEKICKYSKGLIILGGDNYDNKFLKKLLTFSDKIKFPIFAEANSSIRFLDNIKNVTANHTTFLRSEKLMKTLSPELLIYFGNSPVSQRMLDFIGKSDAEKFFINENGDLKDPSQTANQVLKTSYLKFVEVGLKTCKLKSQNEYFDSILELDHICERNKIQYFNSGDISAEPNLIKNLIEFLPSNSNIFVSNSMPIRDFDFFTSKSKKEIQVYSNRGASGIDGIISTAAGVAINSIHPTFLIIGDLAFHHDTNGLQIISKYKIPLKIILINNGGGRIFDLLPIAKERIDFGQYFRTELNINFKYLVKANKGNYKKVTSLKSLKKFLINDAKDFSVFEISTDTEKSIKFRKDFWNKPVKECEKYLFQ